MLAQRQFEYGHVEEACATWHTFLDDYAMLSTARGDEHFETMRRRTASRRRLRAVRQLDERARQVAAVKGQNVP